MMSNTDGQDSKGRVLIVEDEPSIRLGFQMALSGAGFDASEAEDGAVAYRMIVKEGKRFDVVVTDLRMPGMSGGELIDAVRKEGVLLPWLVVSAWVELPQAVQLISSGVANFMKKPVMPGDLRSALEGILENENTYGDQVNPPDDPSEIPLWLHSRIRRRQWAELHSEFPTFFNPGSSNQEELNFWRMVVDCVQSHDGEVDPSDPGLECAPLFDRSDWFSFLAVNS